VALVDLHGDLLPALRGGVPAEGHDAARGAPDEVGDLSAREHHRVQVATPQLGAGIAVAAGEQGGADRQGNQRAEP
jgi:hypothetical protein